ncbi:MAG: hypothetical protein LBR28_01655 [Bacteroidales bacterium]|jgi:UDP-N-acetylmuramoylalanine--D-glutamate ligase|nr:hypothetical protein [Bacteroidales bacterium]
MKNTTFYIENTQNKTLASRNYASIANVRKRVLQQMFEYNGIQNHRMREVATVKGVKFIDDAAALCANSTWFMLESLNQNAIWIIGCERYYELKSKNYEELSTLIPSASEKVRILINIGNEDRLKPFVGIVPTMINVANVEEAVKIAYEYASNDDVVVFSPACGEKENVSINATNYIRAINEL